MSPKRREFDLALDVAAASAALMTVASAATAFFTFLLVTAVPFDLSDDFGQKLGQFVTTIELGQAWLTTTLIAAAVTVLCFAVRNQTALVVRDGARRRLARAHGAAGPRCGRRGPQRRDLGAGAAPRVRGGLGRRVAHARAAASVRSAPSG